MPAFTLRADGISPSATRRKTSPTSSSNASGGRPVKNAVKRRTQAVNVARRTNPVELAQRLLGAHVLRRAQSRAVQGRLHAAAGDRPESQFILHRRLVSPVRSIGLARPQSTTRVSPNLPSITLDGFKSRWSTPRLWA